MGGCLCSLDQDTHVFIHMVYTQTHTSPSKEEAFEAMLLNNR